MIRLLLNALILQLLTARTARAFQAWDHALDRADHREALRLDQEVERLLDLRERVILSTQAIIAARRAAA